MKKIIIALILLVSISSSLLADCDNISVPYFSNQYWNPWSYYSSRLYGYSPVTEPICYTVSTYEPYMSSDWIEEMFCYQSERREGSTFSFGGMQGRTYLPYPDQLPPFKTYSGLMPAAYGILPVKFQKTRDSDDNNHPYRLTCSGGGSCLYNDTDEPDPKDYPNFLDSEIYCPNYPLETYINTTIYNQLNYSDPKKYAYGQYGTATIADYGCFLCCVCTALNRLGIAVDPPTLNTWLRNNHGYAGLRVDVNAVLRYASKVAGVPIGFKRNVPLLEALLRGLQIQCSVKFKGHWVKVVGFEMKRDGTIRTIIADPANGRHVYLEDYAGVDKNNTRCFYKKAAPKKTTNSVSSMAVVKTMTADSSTDAATDNGLSGISVYTTSPVEMSLVFGGQTTAQSERDELENAQTGQTTDNGAFMETSNAASGDYTVALTGIAGQAYELTLRAYDDLGAYTERTYSGTLSDNGTAQIIYHHHCGSDTTKISDILSQPDGTYVSLRGATVTAFGDFWLMIQDPNTIVPALYVGLSYFNGHRTNMDGYNLYGTQIDYLVGQLGTKNGSRILYATDAVSLSTGGVMPKPVAVTPENVFSTKGIYTKTWGKITEIYYYYMALDNKVVFNKCTNFGPWPDQCKKGALVAVNGVCPPQSKSSCQSMYVGSLNDVQVLAPAVK